jgi:hypothetical protein
MASPPSSWKLDRRRYSQIGFVPAAIVTPAYATKGS